MMKNTETLTLIDGNFTHDEGKEILSNIIYAKINFHNMKNWSSQELFGKPDDIAKKRMPALKKEMKKLDALITKAKKYNKRLVVSSQINILLIDE